MLDELDESSEVDRSRGQPCQQFTYSLLHLLAHVRTTVIVKEKNRIRSV
jgi:hypothetical protein